MEWRRKVGEEEANAISKRATTRGNKCHKLAEDYLSNKPLDRYRDDVLSLGLFHQIILLFASIDISLFLI